VGGEDGESERRRGIEVCRGEGWSAWIVEREDNEISQRRTLEVEVVDEPRREVDGTSSVTEAQKAEERRKKRRRNELDVPELLDVSFAEARRLHREKKRLSKPERKGPKQVRRKGTYRRIEESKRRHPCEEIRRSLYSRTSRRQKHGRKKEKEKKRTFSAPSPSFNGFSNSFKSATGYSILTASSVSSSVSTTRSETC
jgi:hypothetical protein